MRAGRILTAVAIGATAVVVGPLAQPASAAVTMNTVSGTTVQVNAAGDVSVTPGCSPTGKATINSVIALPAINCGAMIQLTVAGDAGNQNVYGQYLDAPVFTGNPKVVASLGDGEDTFVETSNADNVDLGPGADKAVLSYGGTANAGIQFNTGSGDRAEYNGSAKADTITVVSTNIGATITQSNPDGGSTSTFVNADQLLVFGQEGGDTISSAGVTTASSIVYLGLYGGVGDDHLTGGSVTTELHGGVGTNTLTGGVGKESFWSESETDVLEGSNDLEAEWIYDTNSLRSGGRTLNGFAAGDTYNSQTHQGDVTMRVRPGTGGAAVVTTSLTRPGQQVVPWMLGRLSLGQSYSGSLFHRGIADVVATGKPTGITLSTTGGGLADITIPSGSWVVNLGSGSASVQSTSYGQIDIGQLVAGNTYKVHGPWTDKNQGFAHRATRDLLFRFATDAERDQLRDQLTAGTKTRAAVAQGIINTDEYRGLDVDRVFRKYLRRVADPGGRTYWINSIRNGKALWRFRAQLFGSNEYFTKAGATNATYVEAAYTDVLGRKPDPSGQAYWTNKLNNGADRGSVALQFINSPEARRRFVDDQFLRFLDRLPTADEQANWVAQLPNANGEQAMILALVSGATYYNRS